MQQAAFTRCSLCDCVQGPACLNCGSNLLCWEDSWPPTRYRMLTASHRSLCSAVTDAGLSGLQHRSQCVSAVAWEYAAGAGIQRAAFCAPVQALTLYFAFPVQAFKMPVLHCTSLFMSPVQAL